MIYFVYITLLLNVIVVCFSSCTLRFKIQHNSLLSINVKVKPNATFAIKSICFGLINHKTSIQSDILINIV